MRYFSVLCKPLMAGSQHCCGMWSKHVSGIVWEASISAVKERLPVYTGVSCGDLQVKV